MSEVLAEVEFWHSRPITPTRRLALGHLLLPVDPAPGLGGILLGAIITQYITEIDPDMVPDVHRLINQVERGERVVQPRLRHRYQTDRHGLGRSVHRLIGSDNEVQFEFSESGAALQQVLGAVYVLERLEESVRKKIAPVLLRAMTWRGPLGQTFVAYLAGSGSSSLSFALSALTDPRAWALEILGFPAGTIKPTKKEIQARFRDSLRDVHPDYGGDEVSAGRSIIDLGEARRVLLS
ncbi:MAG: hypothetical protein D4R44_02650 [Actinobacteria bacterium]|nr:MAG: hypothetical protein D4R44_02650 [Actinomycetota bacterium]